MNDPTVITGTFTVPAAMMADLNTLLMKTVEADGQNKPTKLSYADLVLLLEFNKLHEAGTNQARQSKQKKVPQKDKLSLNRNIAINKTVAWNYMNGMEGAEAIFNTAVHDALQAEPAHFRRPGQDGTWCSGRFGYVRPLEAANYLAGNQSEIVVSRSYARGSVPMPLFFEKKPTEYTREEASS